MKRTELLAKLEETDRAIEAIKASRRRLTRKIRVLRAERRGVLALLGDGAETSARKAAPRCGRGGRVREVKRDINNLPQGGGQGKLDLAAAAREREEAATRRLVRELDGAGSRADVDRILREYGLRRLLEKKGGAR